jgi:hypothetical protein
MSETTCKNGTMTSEGFIPHIVFNGYKIPVVIDVTSPKVDKYYAPLRIDGELAYALPEGKIFQNKA